MSFLLKGKMKRGGTSHQYPPKLFYTTLAQLRQTTTKHTSDTKDVTSEKLARLEMLWQAISGRNFHWGGGGEILIRIFTSMLSLETRSRKEIYSFVSEER